MKALLRQHWRPALARWRWRCRTTRLWTAVACGLLLLAGGALIGMHRPQGLGLGPGTARIAGELTRDWLAPGTALLLLALGTPMVLDGLSRGWDTVLHRASAEPDWLRHGLDWCVTFTLFGVVACCLALPLLWGMALGVWLPGTGARLLLQLGLAALLGTVSSHLSFIRSRTFGQRLARGYLLQAGGLGLWLWLVGQ